MNTPLEQLYRLQDRIRFVRARELERDTIPSELVEVDREFREKVDAVDRLKKRRAEAEVERRRAHAELSEHREKLRKYQTQLRAVQNQREYGAVLNEIDGVEKLVRSAEDRILTLDEELENAAKDLVTREEMLPLETEQHEERLKDWRSAQRAINEELASAQEEIKRLEASMHPRDRSEFQRLMEKKGGLAIVLVSGNSCSACHVKVRPAGRVTRPAATGCTAISFDDCMAVYVSQPACHRAGSSGKRITRTFSGSSGSRNPVSVTLTSAFSYVNTTSKSSMISAPVKWIGLPARSFPPARLIDTSKAGLMYAWRTIGPRSPVNSNLSVPSVRATTSRVYDGPYWWSGGVAVTSAFGNGVFASR